MTPSAAHTSLAIFSGRCGDLTRIARALAVACAIVAAGAASLALAAPARADETPTTDQISDSIWIANFSRESAIPTTDGGTASPIVPQDAFLASADMLADFYGRNPSAPPAAIGDLVRNVVGASCTPASACTGQGLSSFDGISAVERALRSGTGLSADQTATLDQWRSQLLVSLSNVARARERKQLERARPLNGDVAASVLQYAQQTDPAEVGAKLVSCAEKNSNCAQAVDKSLTPWMKDLSVNATPEKLQQSPVMTGEPASTRVYVTQAREQMTQYLALCRQLQLFGASEDSCAPITEVPGLGEFFPQEGTGPLPLKWDPAANNGKGDWYLDQNGTKQPVTTDNVSKAAGTTIADANATVKTARQQIDANLKKTGEWPKAEAEAATKSLVELRAQLEASRAVVGLFAQITAVASPEASKQIKTVGNAVIDVGQSLVNCGMQAITIGANLSTPLGWISAAAALPGLVSSFTQAGQGLADLWFGTPRTTTPAPSVAQQLTTLTGEVGEIKTMLKTRMDRVDRQLGAIFQAVTTNFEVINSRFDKLDSAIDTVASDLAKQRALLDTMERNMRQLAKDAGARDLWTRYETSVGYTLRNGHPMTADTFDGNASAFYLHATNSAFDSLSLNDTGLFSDGSIVSRLADPPYLAADQDVAAGSQIEENINWIGEAVRVRTGRNVLNRGRLPNFREWAIASRAYSRMLIEQPENRPLPIVNGSNSRLDDIERVGDRLRTSFIELASDPEVFDKLAALNLDAVTRKGAAATETTPAVPPGLKVRLDEVRDAFIAGKGLNTTVLYGSGDHGPDVPVPVNQTCPTSLSSAQLGGVKYGDAAPSLAVIGKLDAAAVRACVSGGWSGQQTTGTVGSRRTTAVPVITVDYQVRSAGTWETVRTQTGTGPRVTICTDQRNEHGAYFLVCEEHDGALQGASWFRSAATFGPLAEGPAAHAKEAAQVLLDGVQKQVRAEQLSALDAKTSTGAPAPLNEAATSVDAAKALTVSAARLGFPNATRMDDQLHGLLAPGGQLVDRAYVRNYLQPAGFRRNEDAGTRLAQVEDAATKALAGYIEFWQARLAEGHVETHPVIADTLAEIKHARLVAYGVSATTTKPGVIINPGTNPGGVTNPGGGTSSPGAPSQGSGETAPALSLAATPASALKLKTILAKGLRVKARCSQRCRLAGTLTLDRATARKLGLGRRATVVARGTTQLTRPGSATLTLKFTPAAKRKLRRARKLTANLSIVAGNSAGETRQSRRLKLTR
jgi:hypothetical protein